MNTESLMQEALRWARLGIFSTAPNPRVGCVLWKDGAIIGRGYHRFAGEAHAEIHALNEAGAAAQGSTAFVTLEPCSHYGKTPPCAEALIAAGVRQVYIACLDPNPLVAGRGVKRLNEAGIATHIGLCEAEALVLNRGFFKRMREGLPWVSLKMASSLDGRSALKNGESQWITGTAARQDAHRHRLAADAIVAGRGSIIQDKARLTARYVTDLAKKNPLRVLIDGGLNIPLTAAVFQEEGAILWAHASEKRLQVPEQVELKRFPNHHQHLDLKSLLLDLAARGCNEVWFEAGAGLAGAVLQAGLCDELVLYLAPCFLGAEALPNAALPPLQRLSDKIQLRLQRLEQLGDDVKITLQALE